MKPTPLTRNQTRNPVRLFDRRGLRTLSLAHRLVLRALAPSLATAALVVSATAVAAPVSRSGPAAADGTVQIVSVVTDIEVIGTDAKTIKLEGELADGAKLEFTTKAKSTDIVVEPPKGRSHGHGSLTIYVPRGSNVHVKTVAGRARMSGVSGSASLKTVSGSVNVDGDPKELEASSVSGDLYVVSASERTRVQSVSGTVHVSGSRGKLEASSVSGKLELEKAKLARCEISTVSGAIEFDGALLPAGPHEIKSHSGRIRVVLPRAQPVEIRASSFSGTIRNKIGNTSSRGKTHISVGTGGPTVQIRNFSGGIVIEPE